jgi:hypothetical protein
VAPDAGEGADGGATLLADMCAAFDTLAPAEQVMI